MPNKFRMQFDKMNPKNRKAMFAKLKAPAREALPVARKLEERQSEFMQGIKDGSIKPTRAAILKQEEGDQRLAKKMVLIGEVAQA